MLQRLNHIRLLRFAGLFTWVMVGLPLFYWWVFTMLKPDQEALMRPMPLLGWGCYLLFGLLYSTLPIHTERRFHLVDHLRVLLLTVAAVGVSYYNNSGFGSLLLVVAASAYPWLLPVPVAVVWMVLSQLALWPIFMKIMGGFPFEALLQVMVYTGLSGFIFVTSLVARQQAQARDEQRQLNAELRATRALLAESARVNERTRIARELHDLLGHHLTALSLNLEVAGHLVRGDAQAHVQQAHTLARLLLSDVREAVSQLRDGERIDMAASLRPLADNLPLLDVDMRMPAPFFIDDAERAHVLLRCTQEIITNTVRHAQARRLMLEYVFDNGGVTLDARDDGHGSEAFHDGNGLRGMRERLNACGGTLQVSTAPGDGFRLRLQLPLHAPSLPSALPADDAAPALHPPHPREVTAS